MIRGATLDPEFIEAGIRTGSAWSETKTLIGYSGEELRREVDESLRWEEAESELRALLKGLSAANRKRRHRIGRSILTLYMILGRTIDNVESRRYLRPHYEEMKRAYLNRKRKRGKDDRVG